MGYSHYKFETIKVIKSWTSLENKGRFIIPNLDNNQKDIRNTDAQIIADLINFIAGFFIS